MRDICPTINLWEALFVGVVFLFLAPEADTPFYHHVEAQAHQAGSQDRSTEPDPLAVSQSNPFGYVNDISPDNLCDELALVMAGDETIDLKAYIEGYPQLPWMKDNEYSRHKAEFLRHHRLAHRPATEVIGSPGTDRIVKAANEASPDNPLVIAVGGDLATVADAYLADPSISRTSVVYLRIGDSLRDLKFNIDNSGWSAYIVLKKMKTVLLLCTSGAARIDRSRLRKLSDSPLAENMLNKYFKKKSKQTLSGSHRWAGDAKALLAAAHPETVQKVRNARIVGLESVPWHTGDYLVPEIRHSDRAGSIKVVTKQTGQTAA